MIYTVTCLSKDAATLSNTASNESLLFTRKDGVQAGTDYTCHVTMTVTAHNGTYLDGGSLGVNMDENDTEKRESFCNYH